MNKFKKSLLSILTGTNIFCMANNLSKAQDNGYSFYDKDTNLVYEEKVGWKNEGSFFNANGKPRGDFGATVFYSSDGNDDGFYETIKIAHFGGNWNMMTMITEEFFVDKKTGMVNYGWKIYQMNRTAWNRLYLNKSYAEIINSDPSLYYRGVLKQSAYHPYLIKEDFERDPTTGGAGRIKRLVNAGQSNNGEEFKAVAEEQRTWFKSRR